MLKMKLWFCLQTVVGVLIPPAIAFLDFKSKKELCQMPVTFEEHEGQTERGEEEAGNEEKSNEDTAARFSKTDSQVHLR